MKTFPPVAHAQRQPDRRVSAGGADLDDALRAHGLGQLPQHASFAVVTLRYHWPLLISSRAARACFSASFLASGGLSNSGAPPKAKPGGRSALGRLRRGDADDELRQHRHPREQREKWLYAWQSSLRLMVNGSGYLPPCRTNPMVAGPPWHCNSLRTGQTRPTMMATVAMPPDLSASLTIHALRRGDRLGQCPGESESEETSLRFAFPPGIAYI